MTPLDKALAEMNVAPDRESARLAYYASFAESDMFLMLEREATGERAEPKVFNLESGPTVLAFDSEERLADFAGQSSAYLALPGRRLAEMLAGQALSLGVNLNVEDAAFLMPPEALTWMSEMVESAPNQTTSGFHELAPPGDIPETLLLALDRKLARMSGLAAHALLALGTQADGRKAHILALLGAGADAQPALSQEIHEALIFSGIEAGSLDVLFLDETSPLTEKFENVGLRFDIPQPTKPDVATPPGMNPDKPPRLK